MSVKIFNRPDIQEFLATVSGLDKHDGNTRIKQITNRIVSDLFEAIDDLNITPDEYWAGIAWLNEIGAAGQAGLISPGLGLDHFLDERLDAIDAELGIENPTPRTIEGPLYIAGAPVSTGYARLDDGSDENGHTLIMHGTVFGFDGNPLPGAKVEVWHCDTRGFYSHFDPTGKQAPFNMRRTIISDDKGRYKFQSILPSGYGVPPGSPTEKLLSSLGRHGQRPAHIHFFVSADGHRKLTTQINIEGDPLIHDDFAYATREGLIPSVIERTDEASIHANNLNAPFAEIVFDIRLTALVDGVDNQINEQRKRAAA
ncbi:catechol 1,2-dioxygenase (plasmid) [Agrobacterium tumefaciens]|jgi:catechol 1,2-dioxygenase|uniref:catechol 1,2-dioxygenase n=1 Tax=Agrobacterium TaxID=357 RepID=UPI00080FC835|nr:MULTISPECIES: catechol 1,2-dioxygenase [Agrobacterium]NSY46455.1 catechol 1,2-dioxygenase [Agrobacterium tumefaciens]NSZ76916.1 catechol 1,2-dioxygenase [Agrobacterium tumefaciens]NSZ87395.1 catechol 1,2-dioxygenase [Agrobacterium tumefaciens]UZX45299.1 catechol 1,2-dioxygenase [Agrobacterium sp. 13-2099-1-2]WCA72708.1 catechol 1,2-dioxygenase [Agrobacterium tumefaciens]